MRRALRFRIFFVLAIAAAPFVGATGCGDPRLHAAADAAKAELEQHLGG
jgi:hypothetical protein